MVSCWKKSKNKSEISMQQVNSTWIAPDGHYSFRIKSTKNRTWFQLDICRKIRVIKENSAWIAYECQHGFRFKNVPKIRVKYLMQKPKKKTRTKKCDVADVYAHTSSRSWCWRWGWGWLWLWAFTLMARPSTADVMDLHLWPMCSKFWFMTWAQ